MKGRTCKRDAGGRTPSDPKPAKAGGEPQVFAEAEKRKRGGKTVGPMAGAKAKHRLDRPGRKLGGRAGADKSPLSSAHAAAGGHRE